MKDPRQGVDDGRDTRLDPLDAVPDATQPGSMMSPGAAADVLAAARSAHAAHHQGSPQPPQPPLVPQEVLFPAAEEPTNLRTPVGMDSLRPSEIPSGEAPYRVRPPRLRTGWPFLPLAPLIVVIVGLAVALAIGLVGLDQLSRAGDEHASARAELLAATISARLAALPATRRPEATELAARRSEADMVVATPQGEMIHGYTLNPPDSTALKKMLADGKGVALMRMGRHRYAVRPIGLATDPAAARLVVLVPEPRAAEGANSLASALAALAVLLLGVAACVAYAVSRDVARDVDFVTDRVRTMAQIRTEPTGELIPTRTMDEVGVLTLTFNKLVGRFGKGERAYRQDLARASAADRERAAFLAAISHELRSPLNAILGFADILMEEVDGPLSASAREEVEQIRGSGAHLLTLINDILEFSALESGQLRLARSRVDVFALANEVVKEARGLVGQKALSVRIEGEPLVARVDARRIRQVLGNLVNNAIKFTQHGEVVIRVARQGVGPSGLVILSVRDTGPGISEQDRILIFEEYKQARSERLRRRGTGLGLAITRRLVMLHHGTIGVESELGRGSIFTVTLPIGNVDAPPSRKVNRQDLNLQLVPPPGFMGQQHRRPGGGGPQGR